VVEAAFERFSAEFLTEGLRAGGALSRGRVSAVHPGTCQTTILSTIVPLRLVVIGHLTTPVWQQTSGLHASIWWPHLFRIVTAFDDLDCAALLS